MTDAAAVFQRTEDSSQAVLSLEGAWRLGTTRDAANEALQAVSQRPVQRLRLECTHLSGWDSALLTFVSRLIDLCKQQQIALDRDGLPEGVKALLRLADAVPEATGKGATSTKPMLERIGNRTLLLTDGVGQLLVFIGEATLAFGRLFTRKARFRWSELLFLMGECGAKALPIVSLIAFLVGVILAFVSAVQLKMFGASIYVANLVGLGMARDMGAMMAGIIMAGRTGAAFAAQIGTMQVNEEIDALRTLGISPMEFLVMPRMIALTLMMPLLCLYADLMGILGGALATTSMSEITLQQYFHQTQTGVPLRHFAAGLFKSGVYGVLIATAGCLRGLQCGRSAQSVGQATTSAVVSSIIAIVAFCAIITVIYFILGI